MVVWGAAVCNPHPLRYIVAKSILCDHKKPYNPVFKLLLYIKMSMSIHTSILHECSARLCSQYGINALIYTYIYISLYRCPATQQNQYFIFLYKFTQYFLLREAFKSRKMSHNFILNIDSTSMCESRWCHCQSYYNTQIHSDTYTCNNEYANI